MKRFYLQSLLFLSLCFTSGTTFTAYVSHQKPTNISKRTQMLRTLALLPEPKNLQESIMRANAKSYLRHKLSKAIQKNNIDKVQILIHQGVSPYLISDDGLNAFEESIQTAIQTVHTDEHKNALKIVTIFLEIESNIYKYNKENIVPWHINGKAILNKVNSAPENDEYEFEQAMRLDEHLAFEKVGFNQHMPPLQKLETIFQSHIKKCEKLTA